MTDFVSLPIEKLLNRENLVSKVERLERARTRPSATVQTLGEIAESTGDLVVRGSIVIPNPEDGLPDVTLDDNGLTIRNQEGDVAFEDTNGNTGTVNIFIGADNHLVLQNSVGDKEIIFLIDDAAHNVKQINFSDTGIYLVDGQNYDTGPGGGYYIDGVPVISDVTSTWTPTWGGLTLGNGTLTTGYQRIGNMIHGHLELVFGNTTSISGDVTFSPPVTQGTYGNAAAPVGIARLIAGGAGALGTIIATSTTSFRIAVNTASGTYVANALLSSTVPGVWTTNDVIQVQFSYFV